MEKTRGKKTYTHAKGFNITSLEGISGIYILRSKKGKVFYIGKCEKDFKNRINSHFYGPHGKLKNHIHFMNVIVVDTDDYPIHVLENFFIWYFLPVGNESLWIFNRGDLSDRDAMVKRAEEYNLLLKGTIEDFLLSFDSVLIKREWDEDLLFRRYGETEVLSDKINKCDGQYDCLCYRCLVKSTEVMRRYWKYE